MHRLLLAIHKWLGEVLECVPADRCPCVEFGIEEAKDTVGEWYRPSTPDRH